MFGIGYNSSLLGAEGSVDDVVSSVGNGIALLEKRADVLANLVRKFACFVPAFHNANNELAL